MTLDLEDKGISRTLWLFGVRELDHKWLLERTLEPGSTVLDVGANIGYYVLLEREIVGEHGKIVALEPSPSNFSLLKKNIELNQYSNIELRQQAVSDHDETREFFIAEESNLNSFHLEHLIQSATHKESILVDVKSIRSIADEIGQIDYMRMDIEGHELEVLQDVIELGKAGKHLPNIIFEVHNRTYSKDRDIVAVLEQLMNRGYTIPYVSSSTKRGTQKLERLGLPSIATIQTDETERSIHQNLNCEHLQQCLNRSGGIRTVYLQSPDTRNTG